MEYEKLKKRLFLIFLFFTFIKKWQTISMERKKFIESKRVVSKQANSSFFVPSIIFSNK